MRLYELARLSHNPKQLEGPIDKLLCQQRLALQAAATDVALNLLTLIKYLHLHRQIAICEVSSKKSDGLTMQSMADQIEVHRAH